MHSQAIRPNPGLFSIAFINPSRNTSRHYVEAEVITTTNAPQGQSLGNGPLSVLQPKPLEWCPEADQVERHHSSLNQFIKENELEEELKKARNDILKTANHLDNLLNDQPNLRKDYQKIFTGTQYALS